MKISTQTSLAASAAAMVISLAPPVSADMHAPLSDTATARVEQANTVNMDPATPRVMTARAVTDLNMREGPGTAYGVLDVILAGDKVAVEACDSVRDWCRVSYEGWTGYSYAPYLSTAVDGDVVYLSGDVRYEDLPVVRIESEPETVPVVGDFERRDPAWYEGYAPVTVERELQTYVAANPVETVYLEGEVVPGAILPANVTVYEVPDYDYTYSYVNGVPVVIDPADRSVVGIVR